MINTLLITGCSYGLGHALALKFAKDNYHVYAVGRSKNLLQELAKRSSNIVPIVADISTPDGRLAIQNSLDNEKEISIIHNAAIIEPCLFKSIKEALLREYIETNYLAPLLITHSLLSWITKGQRVLHITSGAANLAIPGLLPYCTTKAATQFAMQCLNVEMDSDEVYFANLRPGMIDTPMSSKLRNSDIKKLPSRDFYIESEKKLIPPEVVAEFIAWVMIKTDNMTFSKTSWNIYDETYHPYWLPEHVKKPIQT